MITQIKGNIDVMAYAHNTTTSSETGRDVSKLGYNLHFIGKVCVMVLRAVLVGAKTCFIPTVKAAKEEQKPERPKPMPYMDLPIYECPPHVQYKDHLFKEMGCPETKILHGMVHPHVVAARQEVVKNLETVKNEIVSKVNMVTNQVDAAQKKVLSECRSPANETTRQVVMVVGGALGFLLGRGSLSRRIFMSGLGTTAAGSLCYPKQTDEAVRAFFFYAAKGFLAAASMFCGQSFGLRGKLPCRGDLPAIPPPIDGKKVNCPKK